MSIDKLLIHIDKQKIDSINIINEIYVRNINEDLRKIALELYKKTQKNEISLFMLKDIINKSDILLGIIYSDYVKLVGVIPDVNNLEDLRNIINKDKSLLCDIFLVNKMYLSECSVEKSKIFKIEVPEWIDKINKYNRIEYDMYNSIPKLDYLIEKYSELLECSEVITDQLTLDYSNIMYNVCSLEKDINEIEKETIEEELVEIIKILYFSNNSLYQKLILEIYSSSIMLEMYYKSLNGECNTVIDELEKVDLLNTFNLLGKEKTNNLVLKLVKNYFILNCQFNFNELKESIPLAEQERFQRVLKSKFK